MKQEFAFFIDALGVALLGLFYRSPSDTGANPHPFVGRHLGYARFHLVEGLELLRCPSQASAEAERKQKLVMTRAS